MSKNPGALAWFSFWSMLLRTWKVQTVLQDTVSPFELFTESNYLYLDQAIAAVKDPLVLKNRPDMTDSELFTSLCRLEKDRAGTLAGYIRDAVDPSAEFYGIAAWVFVRDHMVANSSKEPSPPGISFPSLFGPMTRSDYYFHKRPHRSSSSHPPLKFVK